jgi:hypothetical protein
MLGAVGVTVKIVSLLVSLPFTLLTTQLKTAPSSEDVVGGVVYVEAVAPSMGDPPLCHWKLNGSVPVAVTLNVAVEPSGTDWGEG